MILMNDRHGLDLLSMFRMTLLITRVITLDNNYRYDSVDDGGLLDGDAQGLHVQVQERVEDGHRGGLEEEDQLDPDLIVMTMKKMVIK